MRICTYSSGAGEGGPYRSTLYRDGPCRAAQIIERQNASISKQTLEFRILCARQKSLGWEMAHLPLSSESSCSQTKFFFFFLNVATEKNYSSDNKVLLAKLLIESACWEGF